MPLRAAFTPAFLHALAHLFPHRLGLFALFRRHDGLAFSHVGFADRLHLRVLVFFREGRVGAEGFHLGFFLLVDFLHPGLLVVAEPEFLGHPIAHFLTAHLAPAIRRTATRATGGTVFGPEGGQGKQGGTEKQNEGFEGVFHKGYWLQAKTPGFAQSFARAHFSVRPALSPLIVIIANPVQPQLYRNRRPAKLRRMIEVSGLSKRYGDFTAVNDLSFTVQPGEVMGLVGPNGAGKTTTLRCATGIIPATAGTLRVAGIDLATDPVGAKRQLAFFPDEPRLFDHLTVRQHLAFAAKIYSVPQQEAEARAEALLAELEIADKADQLPGELSRGMKQKLVIACGLLHSPRVLFFDEPLTGLDPLGIRRMKDTIRRLSREGAAIILSSHLLSLLEEVCTHVLIMKQGQRIAVGTLPEVVAQFSNGETGVSLEEVFIRATGGSET